MKVGDKTRQRILTAGLKLWPNVSPSSIARALHLNSHTNVIYHFKTTEKLKNAVAEYAVKMGDSRVVTQLIAGNHKAVKNLSQADRLRHLNAV